MAKKEQLANSSDRCNRIRVPYRLPLLLITHTHTHVLCYFFHSLLSTPHLRTIRRQAAGEVSVLPLHTHTRCGVIVSSHSIGKEPRAKPQNHQIRRPARTADRVPWTRGGGLWIKFQFSHFSRSLSCTHGIAGSGGEDNLTIHPPTHSLTDQLYKVVRREAPNAARCYFDGRGWQLRQRFVSESVFAQEWFVFITEDSSTLFAS